MSDPAGRRGTDPVGRIPRLVDLGALLLFAGGGLTYLYARHEMRELSAGRGPFDELRGPRGGWNISHWGDMVTLSRVALGITIAGVVVGIVAFALHMRAPTHVPTDEQANHT